MKTIGLNSVLATLLLTLAAGTFAAQISCAAEAVAGKAHCPQGMITAGTNGVYDPSVPEELRVRDGLANFFTKLEAGKTVRIAYFGGSITAANGWRPKTLAWFKSQFPKAELIEINAAISGTGTEFGACRIATDVLSQNPDLVFIEFRVNGGGDHPVESVEGLLRQIRQRNPQTDICLVYTIAQWHLKDLQAGKTPAFGAVMEKVANAHGVPSIDLGVEIARREQAGSLIFKGGNAVPDKLVFSKDGVHPGDAGHDVYTEVIARSMLTMKAQGKVPAHLLRAPLAVRCWETAALLPVTNATLSAGWKTVDVKQDPMYCSDLVRTEGMLRGAVKCERAGETITVKWKGTTLGFSDIPQGKEMQIEAKMDNAEPVTIQRPQTEMGKLYSRFFFLPEQTPGEHTVTLKVKTLPSGTAFYLGQILVVGQVAP